MTKRTWFYTTTIPLDTDSLDQADRVAREFRDPAVGIHAEVIKRDASVYAERRYDVRVIINHVFDA